MMNANPLVVERVGNVEAHGVLCLNGPLTIENVLQFQNAIRREEKSQTVIVDLTQVPYIDSSGLGSLVSACVSRQKAGRGVALAGVNDRVFRLFEVTRTDSLFLIFPTVDDALAALTSPAQA
ncbi:MAG TPA: STAS domain-containing protein [Terriglobales bacterium]|nr:STAS domain-containing protein [Terriglobales bacterium]